MQKFIQFTMFKIFDLHNDYLLKIKSDYFKKLYLKRNLDYTQNIIGAVWTSELSRDAAMREIIHARDFVNSQPQTFLAVEDLHFLSKEILEEFALIRPLYTGLTWNNTNCLAGGAEESGRLTLFGKQVIKTLEASNIQIDTAHLNEESFMDVAKLSKRPLFCSHTACFGVHAHPRNLKDYQIKMVIDSGGIVGLSLVSEFLDGSNHTIAKTFASHIDYFACKFGINGISVGTDFFGTKKLPKDIKNYHNLLDKVSEILKSYGYTEKSIQKILSDNANEFFSKTT